MPGTRNGLVPPDQRINACGNTPIATRRMNANLHKPTQVEVFASGSNPNVFSLKVRYAGCIDGQYFRNVHIPQALRPSMAQAPRAFHLETLRINSPSSRMLPGGPEYVVLGTVDAQGSRTRAVPAAWSRYGQIQAAIGLGSALAAALMLSHAQDPMSAFAVAVLSCISISAWRRRQGVLVEPFTTFSRIG